MRYLLPDTKSECALLFSFEAAAAAHFYLCFHRVPRVKVYPAAVQVQTFVLCGHCFKERGGNPVGNHVE